MTFGEKLLKLRRQEGFSQEDLAGRLNVSRQAVSRWEQGETLPDAPNLLQISRLFGVSTDYLLCDEFESDRDIPAVRTTETSLRRESRVQFSFLASLGLHAFALLYALAGIYVYRRFAPVLLSLITSVASLVGFEIGFHFARLRGQTWEKANDYRRLYYRIAVWLVSFVPIRCLMVSLFRLYPRSYSALVPELCAVLLYLAVCLPVTFLLRKKTS